MEPPRRARTAARIFSGAALLLLGLIPQLRADASEVVVEPFVTGLSAPVFVDAPAGDDRLFVAELGGRVRIVSNGSILAQPFLDLSGVVGGGEWGLLGMAFHPDYGSNGRFYVHYVDAGGLAHISEFTVSGNPDLADSASERILLTLQQPFGNHNGGMIAFGPDGMLYVAFGDGGSQHDPYQYGQNTSNLFGTIVRIDPDAPAPHIPPDNPFVGSAGDDRIWAYGFRNPWRFSIDTDGTLIVGDVGQGSREEIDLVPTAAAGDNYGWDVTEGSICHEPAVGCDMSGKTLPILEYNTGSDGCSVTGGYVYRGAELPSLAGTYFYGDFCSGWVRSFVISGGVATQQTDWTPTLGTFPQLVSFGTDGHDELYIVSLSGTVYKLEAGVDRAAGADRYSTAAAVSAGAFSPGVPVAYIAVGDNFPDALGAGAAAGALGGPVLLTQSNAIPTATRNELIRLQPQSIVVVGGTAVISPSVQVQLGAYETG